MDQQTQLLRRAVAAQVDQAGLAVRHLPRPSDSKEDLVCVLSAVEPGLFYGVAGNRQEQKLELRRKMRPALHYYFYWDHPALGLINARVASYFPYDVHICLNGRAWLARQMDQAGLAYRRSDNCFTWIQDVAAA